MNSATKAVLINPQQGCLQLRAALFHSTPVLERKRRTHWDSRFSYYSNRSRKLHAKQTLLRNVSAFADHLFQSWQSDYDAESPSDDPAWFRRHCWGTGSKRGRTGNQGPKHRGKRGFQFCEDNDEVETIFRSAFGGNGFFYWSFVNEENPQWRSSSGYSSNFRNSWKWRDRTEDEYESSSESENSESDLASERVALGLSASGPLKLEDVKDAYRVCALKWHPDRHQGSSKAVAEEKFKVCSAAYQSICDKLLLN